MPSGFRTPPPQAGLSPNLQETPSTSAWKAATRNLSAVKATIGKKLGSGAFGDVFEATLEYLDENDKPCKLECVAKRIKSPTAEKPEEFAFHEKATRNQIASAQSGVTKSICDLEIHGEWYSFSTKGIFSLQDCKTRIAEFYTCPNVEDYRTFHQNVIIDFSDSMIRSLETFQKANAVHADIKPANLVYRSNPSAIETEIKTSGWCLIDFGCVTNENMQSKDIMGTPHYMAPEVVSTGLYSSAYDVYSFGQVLKELMGEAPAFKENIATMLEKKQQYKSCKDSKSVSPKETIKETDCDFYTYLKAIISSMTEILETNRPNIETLKNAYCDLKELMGEKISSSEINQYYTELCDELKNERPVVAERSLLSLLADENKSPLHSRNPNTLFSSCALPPTCDKTARQLSF